LSDIYLAKCDRAINGRVGDRVRKVVPYVDDYLVVLGPDPLGNCDHASSDILGLFTECSPGLRFKVETPTDGELQFLDLRLRLETMPCVLVL
ncbi:MAG: hypothetical protein PV344_00340, partial [Anaplasma sp.]|nr:hypothetical protein [Anaplasma sp.]